VINRESSEIDFQLVNAIGGTGDQSTATRLPVCGGGGSSVYSVADLVASGSNAFAGLRGSSQSIVPYFSSHYCFVAFTLPHSFLLFCHFSDNVAHGIHIPPLAASDLVWGIPSTVWSASGMSLSALEANTDLGMCQMKIAPSVPAVTMNCWLGEMAI
jgi:hypothetical protein